MSEKSNAATLPRMHLIGVPVFPPGLEYLMRVMSDENIDSREQIQAIELFPTIVARLISVANSAGARTAGSITTLPAAFQRLGFHVVRAIAVGLAVSNVFDPARCPAFDALRHWLRALLVADISTQLVEFAPPRHREQLSPARSAALLHNIGALVLAHCLPREANDAFDAVDTGVEALVSVALKARTGFTTLEAGAQIAGRWELPATYHAMFEHLEHSDYEGEHWAVVHLVAQACHLCSAQDAEWQTDLYHARLAQTGIDEAAVRACHGELPVRQQRLRQLAADVFKR